ncbi:hypothetical protein Hanom_Chr15g01394701 [Helianthus anomalus]
MLKAMVWFPPNEVFLFSCFSDSALRIVTNRPELDINKNVLEVLAKTPDAFSVTASYILRKLIN